MPIIVSMAQSLVFDGKLVGQDFYERTGFVTMAVVIMSIQVRLLTHSRTHARTHACLHTCAHVYVLAQLCTCI